MIQVIGVMIGSYIITRMVYLIGDDKNASWPTRLFAIISIIVSIREPAPASRADGYWAKKPRNILFWEALCIPF